MKEEELENFVSKDNAEHNKDKNLTSILLHIGGLNIENNTANAWQKFEGSIKSTHHSINLTKTRKIEGLKWLAVACAVGLLFGWIIYSRMDVLKATKMAEQKNLVLPDGSVVFLNADSKINFNKAAWLIDRNVFLKGEAFFNVSKGEKFKVNTDLGKIIVKGTKFNVKNRLKYFEVDCIEGKVMVVSKGKEILLTKGLSTKIDLKISENLVAAYPKNSASSIAWLRGDFMFDSEPLEKVIEEMERQFDIKFEIKTNINKKYTGKFNTKNLNESLELVFKPLGLMVQQKSETTFVLYN